LLCNYPLLSPAVWTIMGVWGTNHVMRTLVFSLLGHAFLIVAIAYAFLAYTGDSFYFGFELAAMIELPIIVVVLFIVSSLAVWVGSWIGRKINS